VERNQATRRGSTGIADFPVGPIPVPGEPFPESLQTYDLRKLGENAVRADVTYLRQDFSVRLPVADPGNWPKMQRYDFLVRARTLKDEERKRLSRPTERTSHRRSILFALRELTGKDGGDSAIAWRALLAK